MDMLLSVEFSIETKVDLFASQPATSSVSPSVDLFAAPDPVVQPENNSSQSDAITSTTAVDPFAAVPLNNFNNSDFFGSFTSHTDISSVGTKENSMDDVNHANHNENASVAPKTPPVKDSFQVKSGIWADSLSRGLIDLNISAPKKVNLADVGIVGGLTDGSEEKDKGPPTSFYMGRAMGTGSGLNKSGGFTSSPSASAATSVELDDFFSSLSSQQHQFGRFQK